MSKTHWKKLTNPNYIGTYSLIPGEDMKVKIVSVLNELVQGADGKKEECVVAKLENQKPFILNITNMKIIQEIAGTPFIEGWAGLEISLYSEKVSAFGKMVDGLRVRPRGYVDPNNKKIGAVDAEKITKAKDKDELGAICKEIKTRLGSEYVKSLTAHYTKQKNIIEEAEKETDENS